MSLLYLSLTPYTTPPTHRCYALTPAPICWQDDEVVTELKPGSRETGPLTSSKRSATENRRRDSPDRRGRERRGEREKGERDRERVDRERVERERKTEREDRDERRVRKTRSR